VGELSGDRISAHGHQVGQRRTGPDSAHPPGQLAQSGAIRIGIMAGARYRAPA
jgi:hypothetical protein